MKNNSRGPEIIGPRHGPRRSRGSKTAIYLFLPFFVFLVIFWLVPLIGGIKMSLYSDDLYGDTTFVGLEHYLSLLNDGRYWKSLTNTFMYTVLSIAFILPLSIVLAHLVRSAFSRLRPLLSFLFILPGLTPPAVLALLFLLVFHGREGLLNQLIVMPFGITPINWLKDPDFILFALVFQCVWRWTGFIMFFILAGLEGIPKAYYEAASLETSSPWARFRSVTLPSLTPVIIFCAVYLVVDAFSLFSGAYVLLGGSGGTGDAGLLLISYTYQNAFTFGKFGTAAAISVSAMPFLILALWFCFFAPQKLGRMTEDYR